MSAPDEQWDVVVVGLHDPRPERLRELAEQLARAHSLPLDEVVEALQDGEIPIHSGLRRHEAERAAQALDARGAAVDLRLVVATSGVYPILRPDAQRRSGTAVGGFIDDSATPPRIGDSSVGPLPLEPAAVEDDIGPTGSGFGSRLEGTTDLDVRVPDPAVVTRRRTIGESPLSLPPSHPPGGSPRAAGIGLHGGAASHAADPFAALANGLDRLAGGSGVEGMLGTLGESDARPQRTPEDARRTPRDGYQAPTGPDSGASEQPEPPPPRASPPASKAFSPPGADSALELDFAAAGLSRPPQPSLSRAPPPGSSGVLPRRSRATDIGGAGHAVRGFGEPAAIPLMGPERVSATMFGLTAGLAIGIVAAVVLGRGVEQESIVGYEAELQNALAAPDEVEAGSIRAPSAIESDLADAHASVRRGFVLKWLAIGVPIGLVLGRLKRWS